MRRHQGNHALPGDPRHVHPAIERGCEVKAKPVDVHFPSPSSAANPSRAVRHKVGGYSGCSRFLCDRSNRSCFRQRAGNNRVIDPFEAERGPEMVAFRRVSVDDVEDDLHAGFVECSDHLFEFENLRAGSALLKYSL